ncbi:DDE superfamily endonuclease [Methylobacterium sp. 174MFSha1.1]|nr:DDE superfamily endonuclease [Methylobacterium sp. 174MFSha1.1]
MRAEAAGDPGPWRQQAVLGRSQWDADALRDVVREHVVETLAEPDAVLVLDETGFLKQGKSSCGVHRQYTGSAGKITNCQIGVFAAYVSTKGHAFLDRALYLPKAWTDDPNRRAATHVPETLAFATKPQLALAVIKRAIAADVPFAWVAADSVYWDCPGLDTAGESFCLVSSLMWQRNPTLAEARHVAAAKLTRRGSQPDRRRGPSRVPEGQRLHEAEG